MYSIRGLHCIRVSENEARVLLLLFLLFWLLHDLYSLHADFYTSENIINIDLMPYPVWEEGMPVCCSSGVWDKESGYVTSSYGWLVGLRAL
jgi:hypothetical protein